MMNNDKNNDKIRKIVKKGLTLSLCAVLAGGVAAGSFEGFSALTGETTVQAADKNDAKLTYAKSEKKADKDKEDSKSDDSKSLGTLRPGRSAKSAHKWRKLASLRQCGHLFATLISRAQELLRSLHEPPHPLSFRG